MSEPENEPTWRDFAACMGLPWDIFFPKRGQSIRDAKAICDTCPVTLECLEDAIQRREPAGVRGGVSAHERRKIAAKLNLVDEDDFYDE